MSAEEHPNEATFFKRDIEQILKRYPNLSVYAAIGALEVVKQNLLDGLSTNESEPK